MPLSRAAGHDRFVDPSVPSRWAATGADAAAEPRTCSRTPRRSAGQACRGSRCSADPAIPDDGRHAERSGIARELLIASAAAVGSAAVGDQRYLHGHVVARQPRGGDTAAPSRPTAEAQPGWQPIADARVARDAVAATQADGTIWVFGGMGADGRVSGQHEGYDPAIDSWKGGEDLPVPVQHAMSVTWQDTPVVLGGWRTEGANPKVATDRVWRVVNSRWIGAAAAVAAPGGGGGRRGGRPHHRHRRGGRRRQAAQHHRDLRRQLLEARRPHPDSATDVGRGVGRQAGVRRRRNQRDL